VCGVCASLCPNRANVILQDEGKKIMVHLDRLCNECGNCASFCPENKAPYRERITIFASEKDLENSRNCGFACIPETDRFLIRVSGEVREVPFGDEIPPALKSVIEIVRQKYPWLL
jgi:putative selenate reductase